MENEYTSTASVLVIGASRGLGLALTEEYLRRGATVVATTRGGSPSALHALGDTSNGKLEIEHVDIDEPDRVHALADRLRGRHFDLLFVVAGVAHRLEDTAATIATDEFTRVMITNTLSPLRLIEVLGDVVEPDGTIAVMSSGQGSVANNSGGGWEIYRASKAALNQLMRSYAARHEADGRALVLVAPGWVKTDLGGPNARLEISESIPGVIDAVESRRGRAGLVFLDHRGRTVPW